MEIRGALKLLRSETGMTQTEIANAVHVNFSTVSRWENQNARPNRTTSILLMELAKERSVSSVCLDGLNRVLFAPRADLSEEQERAKQLTESMKLEQKELITSEQFRMTIDNLDVAVVAQRIYHDAPGKTELLYYNARLADIFGYTASEFDERIKADLFFASDADSLRSYMDQQKRLLTREIQLSEFAPRVMAVKKDGARVWLEVKALSLQEFSFGHELFVSCRDVTKQQEDESAHANLLDALPGGVMICKFGQTNEAQYFSDGILRLNGYSRKEYEDIVRSNAVNNVYSEDRAELAHAILPAIAAGKPFSGMFRIRHKEGYLAWAQVTAKMMREEPDGKVYSLVCIRPPIGLELYKSIVDQSEIAVLIAERKTRRIIFANREWTKFCGVAPEANVTGLVAAEVIPSKRLAISEEEIAALPTDGYAHIERVTADGQHLRLNARRMDINGYDAYICYVTDETVHWQNRHQMQQLINGLPNGISVYEVDDQHVTRTYSNNKHFNEIGIAVRNEQADVFAFVLPQDRHIIAKVIDDIRAGTDTFDILFRIPDQLGKSRWIRCAGSVARRDGATATVYCSYSGVDAFMDDRMQNITSA